MSVVPKPPTVPKPKSLAKTDDVATAEHAVLLKRVWRNLDGIIDVLFSADQATFDEQVGYRVEGYLTRCAHAAQHAHQLAGGYDGDPRVAVMNALAKRLAAQDAATVPPLPATIAKATIATRTLEEPLVEWKMAAGNKKRIEVGFVDIACQVDIPHRVELRANLPGFLNDGTRDALLGTIFARRTDSLTVDEIGAPLEAPRWITEDKRRTVWIDVRVTAPALGQLVRELKTLRGYCGYDADVLVVMPVVDEDIRDILLHEDFTAIDVKWLAVHQFA